MKKADITARTFLVSSLSATILFATFISGCSSSDSDDDTKNTSGGTTNGTSTTTNASSSGGSSSSGGGASSSTPTDSKAVVGTFSVVLNPAVSDTPAYATVYGKAYSGPVLSSVIQTVKASNTECAVYAYSQQSCAPTCSTSQTCVGPDTCQANPTAVTLGDVSIAGIGGGTIKLTGANGNYQYAGDITYPGFAEGDTLTLSTTGDKYPAFSTSTKGVAPLALTDAKYQIASGKPLEVSWTPSAVVTDAKVSIGLNISKHGGSAGYLECSVSDTGSYTIPADLISALIDLGVAGFPQLTVTRSSTGDAQVSTGIIEFVVQSLAIPTLEVEGYCSCFNSSECGSCSDTTKTTCDTVKKLCTKP